MLEAIAGVWDAWEHEGAEHKTFSLITTRANPLLEKIHNKKKRMPAIIRKDDRKRWLEDIGPDEIMELLEPIDDSLPEAHPVSRPVSFKNMNRNVPEAIAPAEYDALKYSQRTLFE